MNIVYTIARILLGALMTLAGADGLTMIIAGSGFMPAPPPGPAMIEMMDGFLAAKYLWPSVKVIELSAGVLLLLNKKTTLAVLLLAPIVYNILGVNFFVDQSGLPVGLVVGICYAVLLYKHCDKISAAIK